MPPPPGRLPGLLPLPKADYVLWGNFFRHCCHGAHMRQHYVYLSLFLNWQVLEDQLLCFIHLFVLSIRPTVLVDNV